MNIITYLNDSRQRRIDNLINNGWFNNNFNHIKYNISNIKDFCVGLLGVDPSKLAQYHENDIESIILVEHRLSQPSFLWTNNNILILSIPDMPQQPNQDLIISFYIEKWFFRKNIICSNYQCLFNQQMDNVGTCLCINCQKELINKEFILDALIIDHLFCLNNKSYEEIEYFLNLPIDKVNKELPINSNEPAVNMMAMAHLIDAYLPKGSLDRKWLKECAIEIKNRKNEITDHYISYRHQLPKNPIFIASRRWNSWTPCQPENPRDKIINNKIGGEYFISDGKLNLVIDPGFGFLKMIYNYHNISVMDIDVIIITHDHPDHSSELANILTLRQIYQKTPSLRVILNPSSYYLYQRRLLYYSHLLYNGEPFNNNPYKLIPGDNLDIDDIKISSIAMFHDEIYHYLPQDVKQRVITKVGISESLGIKITGKSFEGKIFSFAIPGDTSFPNLLSDVDNINNFYGKPDIAAFHIGSVEEKWIDDDTFASKIDYGDRKHLGFIGTSFFINLLKPKLSIISEFGEELFAKDYRVAISELLKETTNNSSTVILPSDVLMFIILHNDTMFIKCACGKGYVPIEKAKCDIISGFIEYRYKEGCESGLGHIEINS